MNALFSGHLRTSLSQVIQEFIILQTLFTKLAGKMLEHLAMMMDLFSVGMTVTVLVRTVSLWRPIFISFLLNTNLASRISRTNLTG